MRIGSPTYHSHKKRKDSPEAQVLILFRLNLKYLVWPYRAYIKTAKPGNFCEELLSENDFEAVLAIFCSYDQGGKAFEAVQKIAIDYRYRVSQKYYNLLNSQNGWLQGYHRRS